MATALFTLMRQDQFLLWSMGVFLVGAVLGYALARVLAARKVAAWISGAGFGIASLASLWGAGLMEPIPRFALDPINVGQVVPIRQSALAWLSDRVRGRKYLVLSFDDGPSSPDTDSAILTVLAKHHAHALFFSICARAQSANGRAALRADVAAGNLVEDHSWNHPHLPGLSEAALRHQIVDSRAFLRQLTGQSIRLFRPPFGKIDAAARAQVRQAGMKEALWGANSEDSWLITPAQIRYWSTRQAYNGAILLMHSRATTAAALDTTLTALERMGYRFVTPVR